MNKNSKSAKNSKVTKSNKAARIVRLMKAPATPKIVRLSACAFARVAARSGFSNELIKAALQKAHLELLDRSIAWNAAWGRKGKDRNGVKIAPFTREQKTVLAEMGFPNGGK